MSISVRLRLTQIHGLIYSGRSLNQACCPFSVTIERPRSKAQFKVRITSKRCQSQTNYKNKNKCFILTLLIFLNLRIGLNTTI